MRAVKSVSYLYNCIGKMQIRKIFTSEQCEGCRQETHLERAQMSQSVFTFLCSEGELLCRFDQSLSQVLLKQVLELSYWSAS